MLPDSSKSLSDIVGGSLISYGFYTFKQQHASHFERIVCEMGNSVMTVDDWSDHYDIIERINQLLIQLHQSKHDMQLVVMGLGSYLKEIKNTYQAWDDWLAGWNKSYQTNLINCTK